MNTQYRVYWPNGERANREVDWPAHPRLDLLREVITPLLYGADLEHVSVLWHFPENLASPMESLDMFVDEMGAIKGLTRNEAATQIYRNNWLTKHPDTKPESMPAIYGVAVLFSRRVWF